MSRNGKQQPRRPRIEIGQANASPEEAAAIAAAIEQFLRDTAPPPPAVARLEPLDARRPAGGNRRRPSRVGRPAGLGLTPQRAATVR